MWSFNTFFTILVLIVFIILISTVSYFLYTSLNTAYIETFCTKDEVATKLDIDILRHTALANTLATTKQYLNGSIYTLLGSTQCQLNDTNSNIFNAINKCENLSININSTSAKLQKIFGFLTEKKFIELYKNNSYPVDTISSNIFTNFNFKGLSFYPKIPSNTTYLLSIQDIQNIRRSPGSILSTDNSMYNIWTFINSFANLYFNDAIILESIRKYNKLYGLSELKSDLFNTEITASQLQEKFYNNMKFDINTNSIDDDNDVKEQIEQLQIQDKNIQWISKNITRPDKFFEAMTTNYTYNIGQLFLGFKSINDFYVNEIEDINNLDNTEKTPTLVFKYMPNFTNYDYKLTTTTRAIEQHLKTSEKNMAANVTNINNNLVSLNSQLFSLHDLYFNELSKHTSVISNKTVIDEIIDDFFISPDIVNQDITNNNLDNYFLKFKDSFNNFYRENITTGLYNTLSDINNYMDENNRLSAATLNEFKQQYYHLFDNLMKNNFTFPNTYKEFIEIVKMDTTYIHKMDKEIDKLVVNLLTDYQGLINSLVDIKRHEIDTLIDAISADMTDSFAKMLDFMRYEYCIGIDKIKHVFYWKLGMHKCYDNAHSKTNPLITRAEALNTDNNLSNFDDKGLNLCFQRSRYTDGHIAENGLDEINVLCESTFGFTMARTLYLIENSQANELMRKEITNFKQIMGNYFTCKDIFTHANISGEKGAQTGELNGYMKILAVKLQNTLKDIKDVYISSVKIYYETIDGITTERNIKLQNQFYNRYDIMKNINITPK